MPPSAPDAPKEGAPPAAARAPTAQSAGRGLLLITGAKVWFMLGASVLGFILPHLLRSKVKYGEWGFILSVVSPLNNVMVTATIQAVSKFASRGTEWVEGVKRAALRMQVLIAGVVGIAYLLAAPLIAAVEHDPGITAGLRLSTGVVVCYAFYAVFVGAANGAREFHKQAGLDATYTTLRALFVCAGAVAFGSVMAAVGGFVLAAATVLVLSTFVVGLRPRHQMPAGAQKGSVRELLRFMAPVALYLLVLNLLMFVDGWLVKRMVAEAAERAGSLEPARLASEVVGIYTAAQSIARIPYQGILSVTFVIFPLMSQAIFASDAARAREYVDKSLRLSLLVVTAMATAVAARPEGLLALLPKEYLPAAPALAMLVFGYVAFSLLSIAGTILNGAGRTGVSTAIAVATLAADVALCSGAISLAIRHGTDSLWAAALGTTTACALGVVVSLVVLQRSFGASLRFATIVRTAIAAAAGIAAGRVLPLPGLRGILACMFGGAVYVAVLFATRELTVAELRRLVRRAPAKKPAE